MGRDQVTAQKRRKDLAKSGLQYASICFLMLFESFFLEVSGEIWEMMTNDGILKIQVFMKAPIDASQSIWHNIHWDIELHICPVSNQKDVFRTKQCRDMSSAIESSLGTTFKHPNLAEDPVRQGASWSSRAPGT